VTPPTSGSHGVLDRSSARVRHAWFGVYDPIGVYRLSEPIGYWNALAIFGVLGPFLALGFVAARPARKRVLAGASLPLLLATVYFTFGRAAWSALGVGLVLAITLDARRLQLTASLVAVAPRHRADALARFATGCIESSAVAAR